MGSRGRRKLFDATDMEVCDIGFCCQPIELIILIGSQVFGRTEGRLVLDELVSEMERLTGKSVSIPTL